MTRKMIVNGIDPEEVRIAVLNDARLEEFDIETRGTEKNKGNIYKAVVIDVEPSLNAAFIDYGADKQGFLTAGDVDPRIAKHENNSRGHSITDLLKPKQQILVQVAKDEVSQKGAVLTTYLSLAGRYLVLTPDSDQQSVSRKIDDDERDELIARVQELDAPEGMGVILRTAGRDRSRADLSRDLDVLLRLWENIEKKAGNSRAPALVFQEQDLVVRALRDYYTPDIDEVVLDSDDAYDLASSYMQRVMPRQSSVLTRYVERRPIFHHYRIEEQLEELYNAHVPLPAGGSIVIETTEALVAIDVNSGKQKTGRHEDTALRTNLEAAEEVGRQLRLRDLGGIIVIDFIDMSLRKNQARVERAFRSVVKNDKARIKVGRISRNGTLELTRQRIRTELAASVFRKCTVCHGSGRILNPASHASAVVRRLVDRASRGDLSACTIRVEPEAANLLRTEKWSVIQDIEQRYALRLDIQVERTFSPGQDDFTFETDPNKEAVKLPEPNFGPVVIPEELRAEFESAAAEEAAARRSLEEEDVVERTKRRRARRRGRKPTVDKGTRQKFDLPSFELIDPKDLGLKNKKSQTDDSEGKGPTKKRRRRRRGRGPRATAQRPQPEVAAAPKKKPGFWSRLFGKK